MLLPFVSAANCPDHTTGYVPSGQSAGTLYVRVIITALCLATTPFESSVANAYSKRTLFLLISAP